MRAASSRTANSARSIPQRTDERTLPSTVRDTLDTLDPLDAERRATFLEFWGDAPSRLANLSPVLHHAFDISLLDLDEAEPPQSPPKRPSTDTRPTTCQILLRMIQHVEEWFARGHLLHQNTADELRGIVRDAVVRRCQWNRPPDARTLQ